MYTHKDLEIAQESLKALEDKWERYSGNNPNKYRAQIKAAQREIRVITDYLKPSGEIPLSDIEKLHNSLDKAFPNAQSNEIVQFEGVSYQRKFYPLSKSRSGKTITEWGKDWVQILKRNC